MNKIKWANVLPITLLVVIVGLGFSLYWFSPANQAQMAYTMRDVVPTPTWGYQEWADYFGIEFSVTPNTCKRLRLANGSKACWNVAGRLQRWGGSC